jgi:hypothetical protein
MRTIQDYFNKSISVAAVTVKISSTIIQQSYHQAGTLLSNKQSNFIAD